MLANPEVQRALAAAGRINSPSTNQAARASQSTSGKSNPSQSPPPGQPSSDNQAQSPGNGPSPKTAQARAGQILQSDALPPGSNPADRAQLYKLPPRIREPLVEGMQEKGPDGYQPLIDAYFRELSKEIK